MSSARPGLHVVRRLDSNDGPEGALQPVRQGRAPWGTFDGPSATGYIWGWIGRLGMISIGGKST